MVSAAVAEQLAVKLRVLKATGREKVEKVGSDVLIND